MLCTLLRYNIVPIRSIAIIVIPEIMDRDRNVNSNAREIDVVAI